jgi:hypothetical protein
MLYKGSKRQVFNGTAEMTAGGLRRDDLVKVRRGTRVFVDREGNKRKRSVYSIVSKKKRSRGKKNTWAQAVQKARKKMGITGFQQLKKGTKFYQEAKRINEQIKKAKKKSKKKSSKKKKSQKRKSSK